MADHIDRRRFLTLAGGVALAAGSLASCTPAAPSAGLLRVAQPSDPTGLDPQTQSGLISMNVLINMFDTLTTRDRENRLQPFLATSWRATDERTWRFQLRERSPFRETYLRGLAGSSL